METTTRHQPPEHIGLEIRHDPDRVTPMLPALRDYQFSLEPPAPPPGSFDADAGQRGKVLFEGAAKCSSCHTGPSFTDAPKLHAATETGMALDEARRSATGMYRTTPCAVSGSTRRTSTTAALQRSWTSSNTTTACSGSV